MSNTSEVLGVIEPLLTELRAVRRRGRRSAQPVKRADRQPAGRPTHAAIVEKLLLALDHRVQCTFDKTPLEDAVAALAKDCGIAMRLDHPAFEEAGIKPDTPVTFDGRGLRLETVIERMLPHLATAACGNGLRVTRDERTINDMVTRVYDVADLVGYSEKPSDFDPIIETITSTLAPTSWDTAGGPGSINAFECRDSRAGH